MNNPDLTQLLSKQDFWSKATPFSDTVLSTRLQLVRNVHGIPFTQKQTQSNTRQIKLIAEKFVNESVFHGLELIEINTIDGNSKRFLRERSIISQNMEIMDNCFVILSKNDDFSILINDEDHFKVQIIKPGLQLAEAYSLADEVDNELNKFATYAFSDNFGYVSSSPSKSTIGISVMLHLPVLYLTRRLNEAQSIVKLNRCSIEGLKEEGSSFSNTPKTFGNLFMLSSGNAYGVPETEILENMEKIIRNIISIESDSRDGYSGEHGIKLEDKICRSYGILKYARKIGYVEGMDFLSDIRLGIILSVVKNINLQKINHCMINIQWSHLQKTAGRIFNTTSEGDIFRAAFLRNQMGWGTING